ncbi:MAG: hypothetical protein ABR523_05475 [Desulfurivibrionaceae bacterium]
MNIKPLYREIPLARIDLSDRTFRLAPIENEVAGNRSRDFITRWAVIHPPVLQEKEEDGFIIVTGRQQIIAARALPDKEYCGCLILPSHTPALDLLALALQEILLSRPATPIEKAVCWRMGVVLAGRDRAGQELGTLLELSGRMSTAGLEKLLTLDREIQEALHRGSLELKTCFKLLDMKQADRASLFEIIAQLRLSSSNQRKIIELCRELEKREARSIAEILTESECLEIVNHAEANPPQKTAMLMTWLKGRCYPRLSEAEAAFRGFVAKLRLPKGAAVEHATSFEKDSLKLTIEFADRDQLAEKWPIISKTITSGNQGR